MVLCGFSVASLIYTWVINAYPAFYLAYLTNWSLILSVSYFLLSIINTMLAAWTPQPPDTLPCCSRIRWTWILYEVALHSEILVVILFWALLYEPGVTSLTFQSIAPHSAVAFCVWLDGTMVNRILFCFFFWFGFFLLFVC